MPPVRTAVDTDKMAEHDHVHTLTNTPKMIKAKWTFAVDFSRKIN